MQCTLIKLYFIEHSILFLYDMVPWRDVRGEPMGERGRGKAKAQRNTEGGRGGEHEGKERRERQGRNRKKGCAFGA